ncbi:MAG: NAD(P)-binding protein [Limimaricola sp.]|uniref:NAD(P)/FAD-dependent oxidoreductase n=1 Tax=Limimaricola sp. TaxID=2211665 RepID=UPI001DFE2CD1|nr:FAD/NAD(P)-binding oxidoreductase [Limimaricola sp.]MBI1418731.1 NAD(P)-binding protein [Limimaricola sp.]
MEHVVVVGAGQAGCSLVAKLRAEGFAGRITLIGAENVPPYQRPPLSKAYLLGEMTLDRLFLRPLEFYASHDIALRLDTQVVALDPAEREITLGDGEVIRYDALALTTGSHPRSLPAAIGGDLDGVHTMRDLADADAMAHQFQPGRKVLIVGGGYIGLEAAAVAAKKGLEVTLLEMAPRILQRVACPETSDYFRELHRAHGVDIRESTGLKHLIGEARVSGAMLSDDTEMDVDFVIVGVGISPATELAESAGLTIDNGILTDIHGRTSDPAIWAAGDCASCLFHGQRIRLESVGNAIDMAEAVALNILGQEVNYDPAPWFWSDQYDCKLQIAGLNHGYDAVHVRQAGEGRSHWYYRAGALVAVDAMNDPRAYMIGKRLIEGGKSPAPEVICNPEADLKALLRA